MFSFFGDSKRTPADESSKYGGGDDDDFDYEDDDIKSGILGGGSGGSSGYDDTATFTEKKIIHKDVEVVFEDDCDEDDLE